LFYADTSRASPKPRALGGLCVPTIGHYYYARYYASAQAQSVDVLYPSHRDGRTGPIPFCSWPPLSSGKPPVDTRGHQNAVAMHGLEAPIPAACRANKGRSPRAHRCCVWTHGSAGGLALMGCMCAGYRLSQLRPSVETTEPTCTLCRGGRVELPSTRDSSQRRAQPWLRSVTFPGR
jgi:hypothetical protein